MARIAGVDLPPKKRVEVGLTYIYGVGRTRAQATLAATGISQSSSTECSIDTCVPFFAACRSRCATSGWSLRRKLPMTSASMSKDAHRGRLRPVVSRW